MMKTIKIFVFLTIVMTTVCHIVAEKPREKPHKIAKTDFKLKMKNFVCHGDNDYIVNLTCFIKPVGKKLIN